MQNKMNQQKYGLHA